MLEINLLSNYSEFIIITITNNTKHNLKKIKFNDNIQNLNGKLEKILENKITFTEVRHK